MAENNVFDRAAIICSAGAVFVAVLGLLGWIPNLAFLGNISPHFIPMAPTTSICFILLGLIVLIQIRYRLRGWSRFSAVAVTLLLSVFGIIELAEYFTGIDIEDFLIPDAGMFGLMRKARMSPATGATFFLSGLATLFILFGENKKKQVKVICSGSGIVGSLVVITGVTIIMGYFYDNPLLYGSETIPMAATTAIGFVFLGVGLIAAAGPDRMPMCLLAGESSRAKLLRVFLPLSILIVISQDVLHRFAFDSFQIHSVILSVLLLMLFTVITGFVVTIMAGVIGRALDTAEKKGKDLSKFPSENTNPVLRITKDGQILYSNEAAKPLLAKWKCGIGETVPAKWRSIIAETLKSEKPKTEEEEEVKGKVFSIVIAPVKDAGYANLYATDITDRKRAEDQVKASEQQLRASNQQLSANEQQLRAANQQLVASQKELKRFLKELSAKNKELQSVVYVASHDLRTPLVNIHGFAGELAKSCEELSELLKGKGAGKSLDRKTATLLDEDIPESLKFINTSADMMGNLLDGLLRISRIGSAEIQIETIDMNKLMTNVQQSLEFQAQQSGATVSVENLPGCYGDVGLLNQVFSNLLDNAIKYLDNKRKGKITISARVEDNNSIYCVEDNGMGIDHKHQEKIFEIYHRLNPEGQVAGEGLGLSAVWRILSRLDGTITVESEPGKGSRFLVTLPNA